MRRGITLRGLGLRPVAGALALKLCGSAAQFVLAILVGRLLGPAGSGAYYLGTAVMMFASVVARGGLDGTLLRFVAAGAELGDIGWVRGVYRQAIGFATLTSVFIGVVLWLLADVLAERVFTAGGDANVFHWMALGVPAFSLVFLHGECFKAFGNVRWSQLEQSVGIPVVACALLAALWALVSVVSPSAAAMTYSIAVYAVFAVSIPVMRGHFVRLGGDESTYDWQRMFAASLPILLVSLMNVLNLWAGTAALGIWGTSSDVGVYSAASRVATLVSLLLYAFDVVNGPLFARLWAAQRLDELASAARRTAAVMGTAALPLVAAMMVSSVLLMRLFGDEFVHGSTALCILALGQLINVSTGSVGYLLIMSGNEVSLRNTAVVGVVVHVALQCLLTPTLGLAGAAISTGISQAVTNLLAVLMVRSRVGFWPVPLTPQLRSDLGSERVAP